MPAPPQKVREAVDLFRRGDRARAAGMLQELQRTFPRDFNVAHSLAYVLRHSGELDRAIPHARKACELAPSHVEARLNLAAFLLDAGQFAAARDSFRKALSLQPQDARAWHGLARALLHTGTLAETLDASSKSLQHAPGTPGFAMWHATTLCEAGRAGESYPIFRAALARLPNDPLAALTYAQRSLYDEAAPEDEVRDLHARAAALLCAGVTPLPSLPPRAQGAGPIRVGYLSGDLREHSVSFFLEPLLAAHDRAKVHVTCYSTMGPADATTARLRGLCDAWRDVPSVPDADTGKPAMTDAEAARLIREDGIDVLVELSGLTPGQRLATIAHRPARVHLSYLGYPTSIAGAGLDARVGDDMADATSAEAAGPNAPLPVLRAEAFWCYRPPADAPQVRPRDSSKPITFGSFNYLAKVTDACVKAWADVLGRVPGSRLVLKASRTGAAFVADDLRGRFVARGVEAGRVDELERASTTAAHLAMYDQIDIALDTFPYCGTTTTCEALFMGVPVVSLAGETHRSRVGLSLLTSVGLPELAARSWDDYALRAGELARDDARLAALRAGLRERLLGSRLCDARLVAASLERLYEATLLGTRR